jgi:hypothetical protein
VADDPPQAVTAAAMQTAIAMLSTFFIKTPFSYAGDI